MKMPAAEHTWVRVVRRQCDGWPVDEEYDVQIPAGIAMDTAFQPPKLQNVSVAGWSKSDSLNGSTIFNEIMKAAEARTRELAMQPAAMPTPPASTEASATTTAAGSSGRFTVPHGICAGSYDAVYISTDLEPDDIIALKLMAPALRGVPLMVVVGEGDVADKRYVCARMLAAYGLDEHATILQGQVSKAAYPNDLFSEYPASIGGCQVVPITSAAALGVHISAFLRSHSAPFAILLKPPHEMLSVAPEQRRRTVCAVYGSFNLEAFRLVLSEAEVAKRQQRASGAGGGAAGVTAAGGGLNAARSHVAGVASAGASGAAAAASDSMDVKSLAVEAAWESQEQLLASFKACLLVKRSCSVGRDASINSGQGSIWSHLASDAGLSQAMRSWNAVTVRIMSSKVAAFEREVTGIFDQSDGKAESAVGSFLEVQSAFEKTEKKLEVLRSILRHKGLTSPLGDPLVSACLLDVTGDLAAYEQRCRLGHSRGKLSRETDASSSVAMLIASGKEQQETLLEAVLAVVQSLAEAASRDAKKRQ